MDSDTYKLYHLTVREDIEKLIEGTQLWFSWYSGISEVTVIAKSEEDARKICGECEELDDWQWPYVDAKYSTCIEIPMNEKSRVVMCQQGTG